jgi:hypothetical protein
MAFSKELPDEILKDYHGPDDFYGTQGIMKQRTKALAGQNEGASNLWFAFWTGIMNELKNRG